jgi:hypothetical protein
MERKAKKEREKQELVAASLCDAGQRSFTSSTIPACSRSPQPHTTISSDVVAQAFVPAGVMQRTVKPSSSKRQQLTVEEAAEIYSLRPRKFDGRSTGRCVIHCR